LSAALKPPNKLNLPLGEYSKHAVRLVHCFRKTRVCGRKNQKYWFLCPHFIFNNTLTSFFERERQAGSLATLIKFLIGVRKKGEWKMSTTFTGYADPFSATYNNSSEQSSFEKKASRRLKKQNKILKQLRKVLKKKKSKKKANEGKPILERIADAFVKAIPAIITSLVVAAAKWFFGKK
jgi:hypothetical protein